MAFSPCNWLWIKEEEDEEEKQKKKKKKEEAVGGQHGHGKHRLCAPTRAPSFRSSELPQMTCAGPWSAGLCPVLAFSTLAPGAYTFSHWAWLVTFAVVFLLSSWDISCQKGLSSHPSLH